MGFASKEKMVMALLERHFELVGECVREAQKMFRGYLALNAEFKEEAYLIDQLEHEADVVRREVEQKLEEGAFLPIHRDDYIRLVELNDQVAGAAEKMSDFVALTRPRIPDFLRGDLEAVLTVSVEAYQAMDGLLEAYQSDPKRVGTISAVVRQREQHVDKLVWDSTRKLFKSELELAEKLHLRMLLDRMGKLSNIMEDVCECVQRMVVKEAF